MKVSMFQSTTQPAVKIPTAPANKRYLHYAGAHVDFAAIVGGIQSKKYESLIKSIDHDYKALKASKLPCFTPSGTFRLRMDNDLLTYSQIICLDYDNVDSVYNLKLKANNDPYTFAAFISPSFNGLKVFVKVNTPADYHLIAYQAVSEYFDNVLNAQHDRKCKNLSRLCFVSSDPDIIYRPNAKIFEVRSRNTEKKVTRVTPDFSMLASNPESEFGWLYNFTLRKESEGFTENNRNNFLFAFACNCNRYGIAQSLAFDMCIQIWNNNSHEFPESEVKKTVVSAYSYTHEHAKFRMPKFDKVF